MHAVAAQHHVPSFDSPVLEDHLDPGAILSDIANFASKFEGRLVGEAVVQDSQKFPPFEEENVLPVATSLSA